MKKEIFNEIKENGIKKDLLLSKYACKDKDAVRLKKDTEDIRNNFFKDIDKIIYTGAYARYTDKTQVFTHVGNDHISKRITHVQMVNKIARTIGRALNLNEDLIEAAALGHDLGHAPFGHLGEKILNKICLENNLGYFNHNVQSVRVLMALSDDGKGKNMCIQTLDAILCHNGEIEEQVYKPKNKTKEVFLKEYETCYKDSNQLTELIPMTLEGCVVKISDIISYIGKDYEDGLLLNLINTNDLPDIVKNTLGVTNSDIINTIILDIIEQSYNKPYIKISDNIYKAIKELKKFNYSNIYNKTFTSNEIHQLQNKFNKLFKELLEQLEKKSNNSNIYNNYYKIMDDLYKNSNSDKRIVIDYMSGMTDEYFQKECELYLENNNK